MRVVWDSGFWRVRLRKLKTGIFVLIYAVLATHYTGAWNVLSRGGRERISQRLKNQPLGALLLFGRPLVLFAPNVHGAALLGLPFVSRAVMLAGVRSYRRCRCLPYAMGV